MGAECPKKPYNKSTLFGRHDETGKTIKICLNCIRSVSGLLIRVTKDKKTFRRINQIHLALNDWNNGDYFFGGIFDFRFSSENRKVPLDNLFGSDGLYANALSGKHSV